MRSLFASVLFLVGGCSATSPGADAGALDAGAPFDGGFEPDAAAADASVSDTGSLDGGDLPDTGSAGPCTSDADCASGAEWCVGGSCVPCDNSGLLCDILCADGWSTYTRNGCSPCECAPPNECTQDSDCGATGDHCYAGAFCTDWCPPGDPSCCFGNTCSAPGCSLPSGVGCRVVGCPGGSRCDTAMCASSECICGDGTWTCTRDCGGGLCVPE